jgi:hypothetical protein
MAPEKRPLWYCPKCGRPFVTENIWHSCVVVSVEEHLARVPTEIGDIYRGFEAMVRDIGPIIVAPVKTRIAFIGRMRFGGCRLQQRAVVGAFILRRRIDSPRFDRVEQYGPRSFGFFLKLRTPDDIDPELRAWFEEAYLVGQQEVTQVEPSQARLAPSPPGTMGSTAGRVTDK